ncbi:MAG TPA: ABC transporter substrate-binding protein [Alphaproteobacteria bacterium]|jgi:peptide/nickel transport system substrate-binding protein
MSLKISRRAGLKLGGAALAATAIGVKPGWSQSVDKNSLTIAYPADVPSWDPIAHTFPTAMSIYKCVFDSPMTQTADLKIVPNVITKYNYKDPVTLELEFRDDVVFHNGDKFTAEDFKFTYDTRPKADNKLAIAGVWRPLKEIVVESPTRAVVHFTQPMPTAIAWWAFLGNFIVPKNYFEKVGGKEGFLKAPIGSGPYKLADYQLGSRIVLEANDKYWGEKPKIKRVTFEVVKDPSARVAAIQSKRVDLAYQLPIREAERLGKVQGLVGRIDPEQQIVLLQLSNADETLKDENVRLAMHHAINKEAISKALFFGKAVPLDLPAPPGTPGYVKDFKFPFDESKAKELLAKSGFSPEKPLKIKFQTTNGAFPNDFEIARAIAGMWKKVGIEADIEVIELAKYYELNHNRKLQGATLYTWGNSTGDPEMYTGYMLDPNRRFSAWKSKDMQEKLDPLFKETDYEKRIAGYKEVEVYAVEHGYSIPLLQAVATIVHQSALNFVPWQNAWIMPNYYSWK